MARPRASVRARPIRNASGITIEDGALVVGARRVPLHSGAMHYWRLDRDAWRRGLEELRNLGMTMVETYAPWGVHEIAPGEYDFGELDPRKDLGAFLDLAHEVGLLAFVRPGPHINAELTWFGLPERIIYDAECQARSPKGNPVILSFPPTMFPVPSYASNKFHEETGRWFDAFAKVVAPRIYPNGPVVLTQVDNEAAFYFRNGPYCQDFHPDAIAQWHTFLEERHGTLEAVCAAHRRIYAGFTDVAAPTKFTAEKAEELPVHLDWAAFHEHLITQSLARMRARMVEAGITDIPVVHNVPLGDAGQPISVPAISRVVDVVGFDYYHARREHQTIKRRTLYIAGTTEFAYAPELGVGAPPWFTPLAHEDSLYCAMTALAYGLRGFNLYMAVDRDRWYGAPIDATGAPRLESRAWKTLIHKLHAIHFHTLTRRAEVALVFPREYGRLMRATHLLGPVSPSTIEAVGGAPTDGCREDTFGFAGPVQSQWWRMLGRIADALTDAGVPYVYVDSAADTDRLRSARVLVTPSFEFASLQRWRDTCHFADQEGTVVYGPAIPHMDENMTRHLFEVPSRGRKVLIDTPDDAVQVVGELIDNLDLARPFFASPNIVETCVHEDTTGPRVIFVINPGKQAVDAEISLPYSIEVADAMSGEYFAGRETMRVPMGAMSIRMLVVEKLAGGAAGVQRAAVPKARARRSS
ncbi:MAG: beta-galactosidase [Sandaracinaceae bacterium]|nr:beta-galactosidase [Sandaracinaceae bacterium]